MGEIALSWRIYPATGSRVYHCMSCPVNHLQGKTQDGCAYQMSYELFAIQEVKKLWKLAPDVLRYVGGRNSGFQAADQTQFRMRAPTTVPNCLKYHEDVEVRVVQGHMPLLYLVKQPLCASALRGQHPARAILHGVLIRGQRSAKFVDKELSDPFLASHELNGALAVEQRPAGPERVCSRREFGWYLVFWWKVVDPFVPGRDN